jgi:hypothetical protein
MSLTRIANNCFNVSFETGACSRQNVYGDAGREVSLGNDAVLTASVSSAPKLGQ